MELRIDPLTGVPVQVAGHRQARPNRPASHECPFCPGGVEAPEPYRTRSFVNRWPSFPDDRCEVVLYSPDHDARISTMDPVEVRNVVDLWAERSASLGARDDIAYVLVFENNGEAVGATIGHPHGQIYAFPEVPPVPTEVFARLERGTPVLEEHPDLVVVERDGWRAWVPFAAVYPYSIRLAPLERRPDLGSLPDRERDGFGSVLAETLGRLERAFEPPMPYMYWIHQRPTDGGEWFGAWMHVEIVGPHRSPALMRHVAAAELGTGVYLNPVDPREAADRLREVEL